MSSAQQLLLSVDISGSGGVDGGASGGVDDGASGGAGAGLRPPLRVLLLLLALCGAPVSGGRVALTLAALVGALGSLLPAGIFVYLVLAPRADGTLAGARMARRACSRSRP